MDHSEKLNARSEIVRSRSAKAKEQRRARNEIWKDIDKIAKDFVEGMQGETQMRVV